MLKTGKYIYGLVATPAEEGKGIFQGIDAKLKLVQAGTVSAVTADAEIVELFTLDNKQIAWKLVEHQQIIEKIMSYGISIIPMKLGSFLDSEEELKSLLQKEHNLINNSIEKIKDKVEFDIVACWVDFASVLKGIGDIPEIKEFKNQLLEDPENITQEQKMKIGIMVAQALEHKKNAFALRIVEKLQEVSISVVRNEVMDDEMLLNTAFMLKKEEVINFENRLDSLDTEFDSKLKFKCIGPLPCYNFYTFEILDVDPQSIDNAVNLLELEREVETPQIKAAYKSKAMKLHPDKNNNAEDNKFNELNKAFKLLSSYCNAFAVDGICSFAKDKIIKNTKILKLKD